MPVDLEQAAFNAGAYAQDAPKPSGGGKAAASDTDQRPTHAEAMYPHLIRERLRVNEAVRPTTHASAIYSHLVKQPKEPK